MSEISFLTPEENACMAHLDKAQKIFNQICQDDPQNSQDGYNFGHYVDAAKTAIIIRGARRIDPEHLMPKKTDTHLFDVNLPGMYDGLIDRSMREVGE